jgi:cysteinyl-tRNA synthetase
MFMLMSHYRSPLNYSSDLLVSSQSALDRIKNAKEHLEFLAINGSDSVKGEEQEFISSLSRYKERFCDAMDDDLNTADAISVIFELVREANTLGALAEPSKEFASAALSTLTELTDVLGLLYGDVDSVGADADAEIEALIEARTMARNEKNWADADRIRDTLTEMGILLEDTPQGVKWKRV